MVTYHYVKFYVSIIIHLEVIYINVRNFNFPIGFYSNPHPLWTPQNMTLTPFTTKLKTLGPTRNIFWHSDRSPLEEQFCIFKIFEMSAIFKMAAKIRHKIWAVKIQHYRMSSKFDMWVDNDVPNWFLTLENFYRSPFSKWPSQSPTN
jgi:hypothetical protein